MQHWYTVAEKQDGPFKVVHSWTYEDVYVGDCFDESCFDIKDMARKIDRGDLDYFMLRARVLLDGHELGEHIVGGFLYEDARETLKDGMAEDCIYSAMEEAKTEARRLVGSLNKVIDTLAE
jgi:hypothetical protein